MKVSYFPGCTLKNKAKILDEYARKSALALGVELEEIKEWQCCGGVFTTSKDEIATKLSSVRALVDARDNGQVLVSVCSACHNVIKQTNFAMQTDKEFADKLQRIMEQQIGNAEFTIDEFASMMGLGRTVFYRKTHGVTGYAPNEYIRIVRMKKAAELLRENRHKVAEVSYQVGINDPFYFSKCFKRQFGVSPSAYVHGDTESENSSEEGAEE